jgi:hypothetical protein
MDIYRDRELSLSFVRFRAPLHLLLVDSRSLVLGLITVSGKRIHTEHATYRIITRGVNFDCPRSWQRTAPPTRFGKERRSTRLRITTEYGESKHIAMIMASICKSLLSDCH